MRLFDGVLRPDVKRWSWLAALAALAMPSAASAQTDVPPVYPAVDENGVDNVTGRVVVAPARITIGPGGPGSLSYAYASSNGAQGETSGGITWTTMPTRAMVRIGPRTDAFTGFATFTNDQGGGATLTYDAGTQRFTFTREDGAVGIFSGTPGAPDRLETLTYPSGERLTYSYVTGRLQSVSSNLGYQLRYIYAPNGFLSGVVLFNMANEACDPAAASCTLSGTWPGFTFSSTATDTLGRVSQIQLVSATQTVVTYATGRTMTYTLNATTGRVSSVTDGATTWTYVFAPSLGVSSTTITASGSATVRNVFWNSTTGTITAVNVGDGVSSSRTNAFVRDGFGRVTNYARPSNNPTIYTYDARGNITQQRQISATPGTPADIITSASYPATCTNPVTCNKPDYVIDARGNRTDYTYDPVHGGVLTVTLPAGPNGIRPQTRYTYAQQQATYLNGSGTPILGAPVWRVTKVSQCATQTSCANSADEVRTTTTYGTNAALLPVSTTSGSGNGTLAATTTMTYTPTGDVRTIDGPLAGTADRVRFYYDAMRQRTGTIGPDPDGGTLLHRAQRLTYNNEGQVTLAEQGTATSQSDTAMTSFASLSQLATAYDGQGRRSRQSRSGGGTTYGVTQVNYNADGLIDCVAERMNPAVFGSLPASACTLSTAGAHGPDRIVRTTYNLWSEPTQITTGYGTSLQAVEATMTYTAQGLETLTDGNGNRTTYAHDGFSRRTRMRYPSPTTPGTSSTTDYEELSYDPASNIISARLRDNTNIAFTYDNLSRLTAKNLPGAELDVTYGYDLLNRMTSAATSAQTLSFGFDALGRNTSQAGPRGTVGYAYDVAGRRTSMTYPDSGLVVGYSYNLANDLTEIRENPSGANVLLATYAWDNLGRRVSLTRGNNTVTTYGYDNVSRLTQLVQNLAGTTNDLTLGFTLNPAGEIATNTRSNDAYAYTGHANANVTGTANGLNQLTAVGGVSNSHDARGNVSAIGTNSYGYSSENMLISAPSSTTLAYDPLNRVYQTVGGGTTTRFGYDGGQMIAEYNSANTLQRRYVFGPGTDEPLVWYEGTGTATRRYFHADERGSVVAVSDASGNLYGGNPNRYDEYGAPQGSLIGRFGYTGQPWLPEAGLYHYRARAYNPAMGRFMQTDPIGYDGGMNLYAYVGNDPVNFVDPLGLECAEAIASQGSHTSGCFDSDNDVTVTGYRPWGLYIPSSVEPMRPLDPSFGPTGPAPLVVPASARPPQTCLYQAPGSFPTICAESDRRTRQQHCADARHRRDTLAAVAAGTSGTSAWLAAAEKLPVSRNIIAGLALFALAQAQLEVLTYCD